MTHVPRTTAFPFFETQAVKASSQYTENEFSH